MIKAYWFQSKNVGDTLTPVIVEFFTDQKVEFVDRSENGKLLAVGSIMKALRDDDIVWGTGCMYEHDNFSHKKCTVLAVRGKLTEERMGKSVGVYGDPALLMPRIYNPEVDIDTEVGILPHYVDKKVVMSSTTVIPGYNKFIDVMGDWKTVIEQIKSCRKIVSSSLHGIVLAEAYGIPAEWVEYSDAVLGDGFKFQDYLTGTGRKPQETGVFPPIKNLKEIQDKLVNSLQQHYANL
jgi:pyruvyltransferase